MVLIAEDEESFVDALVVGLQREGFDVIGRPRRRTRPWSCSTRSTPTSSCSTSCCPRCRGSTSAGPSGARSSVPIIMVTAKGTEIDTVVGLEVGADDYVTKPYRLRELVARMRAVLRRTPPGAAEPSNGNGSDAWRARAPARSGGLRVDPDRHRVFVRGEEVHLRRKEFELLRPARRERRSGPHPRHVLIDRIWGTDYVGDTKTLDVHIKRLRAHVEPDPSPPDAHHHRPRASGTGFESRRRSDAPS